MKRNAWTRTTPLAPLSALLLGLFATPAAAYVGPGAGLSLLGALWGLALAIFAALSFIVVWPLRRYRRRMRARQAATVESDPVTHPATDSVNRAAVTERDRIQSAATDHKGR